MAKRNVTQNCIGHAVQVKPDFTVKRFYTDGAHIAWTCPKCGKVHCEELDGDGINYPTIGEAYKYSLQCDDWKNCGYEDGLALLTFSLSVRGELKL